MNEVLSNGFTLRFSVEITKPLSLPHTLLFMDVCSGTPRQSHSLDPRDYDGSKPNPSKHTWPLFILARRVSHLYSLKECWLMILCVLAFNINISCAIYFLKELFDISDFFRFYFISFCSCWELDDKINTTLISAW